MINNRERKTTTEPEVILKKVEEEPGGVKEITDQNSIEQISLGWGNAISSASCAWEKGCDELSNNGEMIFAFKNTESANCILHQIIVYRNFYISVGGHKEPNGTYGVFLVTSKYSELISRATIDDLNQIYNDLIAIKVDKRILTKLREIIEENETPSN